MAYGEIVVCFRHEYSYMLIIVPSINTCNAPSETCGCRWALRLRLCEVGWGGVMGTSFYIMDMVEECI
jgi:hypothetical protein